MRRIAVTALLIIVAWAAITPHARSQVVSTPLAGSPLVSTMRSTEADLVRSWYRDYLGREVGPELTAWVELLKGGMSPTDVQATILGSDEFYYQKGRDPQTFVLETLQAITWSEPTVTELRRWTDRLTALRGDRFALVREILLSRGQPQTGSTQVVEVVHRLQSASRLLVDTIDFEIGGTSQGRQASLKAQALDDAVEELHRVVSLRSYRPDEALLAIDNASRSSQALESTLNNPPGTAPSAASVARRIGTMLTEARGTIRPPVVPVPGSGTGGAGYDQQKLFEQITAVSRGTQSLIQLLTSQSYQSYTYSVVLRDLDTFAANVDEFDDLARRGTARQRLQWELDAIRQQADRIEPQLLAGRPPYFVRLYWQSVESSLDQMRDTLGATGSGGSTVLRPTPFHDELSLLVDQAIAQVDVFLTGTNPLVVGVPDVPRVQRDVRNLRTRLLTLRQQSGAGEPASVLQQTLGQMVSDYQNAYNRWNQVLNTYRLLNPARLSPVGETLNRAERMINDALASGDLTPSGPTRISGLIASLDGELAGMRTPLAAFAGYPEQRGLGLFVEQCVGYTQSIEEAQATASTSIDSQRRLAAAMQRVIGLMQAEADSLNQRVLSTGTRDQQTKSADLRRRVIRIGSLADEIEAELH